MVGKHTKAQFDYDSIPAGYYDKIFGKNRGIRSKWHHLEFNLILESVGDLSPILDIGCGPGSMLGMVDGRQKCFGVDTSISQIEYATSTYGSARRTFQKIDGPRLPFDDATFAVASLVEVIEHLIPEQAHELLKEAKRVLRPGGKLLITTPNYRSLWLFLEFLVNRVSEVTYEEQHILYFTRDKLFAFLAAEGFSSVSVESFMFTAPFLASLSWKLSDACNQWERRWIPKRWRFLLFAKAQRPDDP